MLQANPLSTVFFHKLLSLTNSQSKNKKISKKDYEKFCKEFVFNKLRGESFGQAFCKRFGLDDTLLKHLSDKTAKQQIETLGYIK